MATNGKRCIFNSRDCSPTVEAIANEAGILPGMAVELSASGFEKADTEGNTGKLQLFIADYNFLEAGDVDTAWTQNETMIARELPKGQTANVLVSAGNNITSRGVGLTVSATTGEWKIATPATEEVLAYSDEIINVTGSAGLVRVKGA